MTSRLYDLIRVHAEALDQLADPIALTEVTADNRKHATVVDLVDTDDTSAESGHRQYRWVVTVAAALIAFLVGAITYAIADDESASEVPADEPTAGEALDGIAEGPTLVASWGQFHGGWVLVYSDGRVILYSDESRMFDPLPSFGFVDRYLTPSALQQIRTGALAVRALFPNSPTPDDVWADSTFAIYRPSEYAVCLPLDAIFVDETTALAQLPTPVQELLRGTLRPYTNVWPIEGQQTAEAEVTPGQCFTVASEQLRTLMSLTNRSYPPTKLDELSDGGTPVTFETGEGKRIDLDIRPVLPDGQTVLWLG